jgi:hypothetical protein
MSIATDNNTSARTRVEAWSAIRGWAQRKARLLGLDSPTKHAVLTRATVPFGPVMRARTAMLHTRGLIQRGQRTEQLVVIGVRRAR